MTVENEVLVLEASKQLRGWIHDANNALCVARGFVDELSFVVKGEEYLAPNFDKEDFAQMLEKVNRGLLRAEENVRNIGGFARNDIFTISGVKKPE